MVDTSGHPNLDGLLSWQAALTRQAENLHIEIHDKQSDLAQVEERLALVTRLIGVETRAERGASGSKGENPAPEPSSSDLPTRPNTSDLEHAVAEILRAAGEPLHISNIRGALIARGVPIPGRGDEANIIVRLRRFDDRFTRTARGTYGLAEWGIPALERKTRKRRRSATR